MGGDQLTVNATESRDILAYIQHALGFQPEEALVAQTMHGSQLSATLRIGLPKDGEDFPPGEFAKAVLSYLIQDAGADGVLFALYTNKPGEKPYEDYMDVLMACSIAVGLEPRDVWLVTDEWFQGYLCAGDAECCPRQSVETIKASTVNTEMILAGSSPTGEVQIPECKDPDAAAAALEVMEVHVVPVARLDWMAAVTTGKLADRDAYQIIRNLQTTSLRDRLMGDLIDTDDGLPALGAALMGEVEHVDWKRVRLGTETLVKLLELRPERLPSPDADRPGLDRVAEGQEFLCRRLLQGSAWRCSRIPAGGPDEHRGQHGPASPGGVEPDHRLDRREGRVSEHL